MEDRTVNKKEVECANDEVIALSSCCSLQILYGLAEKSAIFNYIDINFFFNKFTTLKKSFYERLSREHTPIRALGCFWCVVSYLIRVKKNINERCAAAAAVEVRNCQSL